MINSIFRRSVFHSTPPSYAMSDLISTLFHRMAATVYLIYSAWAAVAIWGGIPALTSLAGIQWATIFAAIFLSSTALACLGATFFPALARLELYAGAAFSALLIVYFLFTFIAALFNGGSGTAPLFVLGVAVLPVTRTLMILYFLLKQADTRKLLEG